MALKRGRSSSLIHDARSAKRGCSETIDRFLQLDAEPTEGITCTGTLTNTVITATDSDMPTVEKNATLNAAAAIPSGTDTIETEKVSAAGQLHQPSGIMTNAASLREFIVAAPEFEAIHDSWEAFDEALKAYGHLTFQLYVIRSTTSVKRRNLKIIENVRKGDLRTEITELGKFRGNKSSQMVDKILIPEHYQWYSKSLKCTHGWKERHRGIGKRGSGVVRSTSCSAKMCVTLQHRGHDPTNWKVVVTKHVRTHNHQLSKELFMYYTENRRIYDTDLLAVSGDTIGAAPSSVDVRNAKCSMANDHASHRSGLHAIYSSSEDQSQHHQASSIVFRMLDSSSTQNYIEDRTNKHLVPHLEASNGYFARANESTPMPPMGTLILTPGTVPSTAMDGGGYCVPRVSIKVHACWTAFHDYVAQYAFDTAQIFRTRSTVSVAARNARILASLAAKTRSEDHGVASYASYATAAPTSRLFPDEFKWFSKLLICTYGWKRRVRGKALKSGEHGSGPCPAMMLARLERNVDGMWQVVINRQVPEHNHELGGHVNDNVAKTYRIGGIADVLSPARSLHTDSILQTSSNDNSILLKLHPITTPSSVDDIQMATSNQREIVVRVPRLQSVFKSWDAFHASLKSYSDATYQLYRTRTTSSVQGRNQKIAQMKCRDDKNFDNNGNVSDSETELSEVTAARKIPESWRWYSKTLTCTHGWKERHRGSGKRNAHGVRSTSCPVKICATVQYHKCSKRQVNSSPLIESENTTSDRCWRVVVTKHVVDHNHNLSRELYQYYCENRRIYDPELLAIDTSTSSSVDSRDKFPDSGGISPEYHLHGIQLLSHSSVLPMQFEAGQTETVSHLQLFATSRSSQSGSIETNAVALSASNPSQNVSSVVLVPYSPSIFCLPSQAHVQQPKVQYQFEHKQCTVAASTDAATGYKVIQAAQTDQNVALLAPVAKPSFTPPNVVLLKNAGLALSGAVLSNGTNVASVPCRIHGASGETQGNVASTDARIAQCTCCWIPGGNCISIVPAIEPLSSTDLSLEADNRTLLYADEIEGFWKPSSNSEIEKMTTESGAMMWRVPRIMRRYPSWETFHKYLDEYSAATFQLYRVRTTYSVRSRNVRLRQLAASRGLLVREEGKDNATDTEQHDGAHGISRAHLVPEQYEWYSKTFLCTHGWKRRSRGSGQRVSHSVRATECPAKVCATLQRTDGSSDWSVVVTKHVTEHNHKLSEAMYQQYSEVRRVRDPAILQQAEQMWRAGGTRRRVFEFLKEQSPGHIVLMKDVHNLVQRWQTQEPQWQTETVSHLQLFATSRSSQSGSIETNAVALSASNPSQNVSSVVLVPYSPSIFCLPSQAHVQQPKVQYQFEHKQCTVAASTDAATGYKVMQAAQTDQNVALLAPVAKPSFTPPNVVLLKNAGLALSGAVLSNGTNVASVPCRIHGASGETQGNVASTDARIAQCTCCWIPGGNCISIVPAIEPLSSTDLSLEADNRTLLYADEIEGFWKPSSNSEIEKMTTESGAMMWRVPRIMRRYPSWETFHKYLDEYSAATFQLYRVRTTYSVRSRNVRLRQLAASRGLLVREEGKDNATDTEQHDGAHGISRAHLVPEQYEWYSKTFLCTHGWKRRSRGSGQRVSHSVRATECPAKVCATLQRTDGSSDWSVVVTKHVTEHNHKLSEAMYQQYSEVRRVRDPAILQQAEQMWRAGGTRRRVFEFLKEQSPGHIVLMKDVHNLVQRWQTQEPQCRQDGDNDDQSDIQTKQQLN
ncbi:hypothetical protein CCR75_000441 [Bremia lactucae]|uniref:Uncharacterized protein n=1 Tax=Bremia lactucae TaxID=4779 RepID=A0A976FHS9_BRELC|nr:hypothetical protein CCR75_000441 [Bremia lactucae]